MFDNPLQNEALAPAGGWKWLDEASATLKFPFLLFLPDGRIGGAGSPAHWRWSEGALLITDEEGKEWRLRREGNGFRGDGQLIRAAGSWPVRSLPPSRSGRRNLVVLRSGDNSLHPLWLETLDGERRTWDLCLSYYGNNPEEWRDRCEYFLPRKGSKFEGLAAVLDQADFIWGYDYIWFPDDDLLIDGSEINTFFATARRFDLLLAQPALAPGCFINHRITEQQKDFRVRFTSFVEIMAPLFSREALAIVAPSFGINESGYGLDHLWPALLGAPLNRIGVVDEVAMVHTRPMGATYNLERASREGWDLLDKFGLRQLYANYGGIPRQPSGWFRIRNGQGELLQSS